MDEGLAQRLEDHMTHDETSFSTIARALERLSDNATAIAGIVAELKEVKITVAATTVSVTELQEVRTDVDWLKKFFWLVVTPLTVALVAAIAALIIRK